MSENPITFPVSVGLLEPKHVRAMPRQTLFVYLWFINRVTQDSPNGDGQYTGAVLGGQPITLLRIGKELGMNERTVRRYVAMLIREGYVESVKTGSGPCFYTITKSKKYCWKRNQEIAPKAKTDAVDPRHTPARDLIQELFKAHFSVTCQWDGSEAKALTTLLKNNPSWTAAQISLMVRNRFASDSVSADRPRLWLANLAKYSAAPLDKFQKPKASVRLPVGNAVDNFRKLLAESGVEARKC
jgi:hypothetical protein